MYNDLNTVDYVESGFKKLTKSLDPIKEALSANLELDRLKGLHSKEYGHVCNTYQLDLCISLNCAMFYSYLIDNQLTKYPHFTLSFIKQLYLFMYRFQVDPMDRVRIPKHTLANITEANIKKMILIHEYDVSQGQWDSGANPYNALRLFFEYLETTGYSSFEKQKKILVKLEKQKIKMPIIKADGNKFIH